MQLGLIPSHEASLKMVSMHRKTVKFGDVHQVK